MSKPEPGCLVLITQDCREGSPATGEYGVYEGDKPIGICYRYPFTENADNKNWRECMYSETNLNAFKVFGFVLTSEIVQQVGGELGYELPMKGDGPEVMRAMVEIHEESEKRLATVPHYYIRTNPRIRLENGTYIWGAQCWWKAVDAKIPPDELKTALAKGQDSIAQFCEVFSDLLKAYTATPQAEESADNDKHP